MIGGPAWGAAFRRDVPGRVPRASEPDEVRSGAGRGRDERRRHVSFQPSPTMCRLSPNCFTQSQKKRRARRSPPFVEEESEEECRAVDLYLEAGAGPHQRQPALGRFRGHDELLALDEEENRPGARGVGSVGNPGAGVERGPAHGLVQREILGLMMFAHGGSPTARDLVFRIHVCRVRDVHSKDSSQVSPATGSLVVINRSLLSRLQLPEATGPRARRRERCPGPGSHISQPAGARPADRQRGPGRR